FTRAAKPTQCTLAGKHRNRIRSEKLPVNINHDSSQRDHTTCQWRPYICVDGIPGKVSYLAGICPQLHVLYRASRSSAGGMDPVESAGCTGIRLRRADVHAG